MRGCLPCHVQTLSLQFGELLGQSVLTLLQLPLLLLHVLHVVSQRLDLGLVLHTERRKTQTPVMVTPQEKREILGFGQTLQFQTRCCCLPVRWAADRTPAPSRWLGSCGGRRPERSPAACCGSPETSPLTSSCWCRDEPGWTPPPPPSHSPSSLRTEGGGGSGHECDRWRERLHVLVLTAALLTSLVPMMAPMSLRSRSSRLRTSAALFLCRPFSSCSWPSSLCTADSSAYRYSHRNVNMLDDGKCSPCFTKSFSNGRLTALCCSSSVSCRLAWSLSSTSWLFWS